MGCCLLSGLVSLAPRLALIFMWIFTSRINLAFDNMLIPLFGLIFLPITTFAYAVLWSPSDGLSTAAWLGVGAAFLVDLAINAGTIYGNRSRILSR